MLIVAIVLTLLLITSIIESGIFAACQRFLGKSKQIVRYKIRYVVCSFARRFSFLLMAAIIVRESFLREIKAS